MFKVPIDLFCQIEDIVTAKPHLLNMDDYHSWPDGEEVFSEEDILNPKTAHCVAGWVVALTPLAAKYEQRSHDDVDDYANRILMQSGRPKLPFGVIHGTKEDAMKLIRGRAAEERAKRTDG